MDIHQNSPCLNWCNTFMMLSRIQSPHLGSMQFLTTMAKLLPGYWKPMNGTTWLQYSFLWHWLACGAKVQNINWSSMQWDSQSYHVARFHHLLSLCTHHDQGDVKHLSWLYGSYISNLLKLHPNTNLKPNHHMSMHMPLFLQLFGPT